MLSHCETLGTMTGAQVKRIRRQLGLTQMAMCRLLGIGRATLARWEAGQYPVPKPVAMLLPRLLKERRRKETRS